MSQGEAMAVGLALEWAVRPCGGLGALGLNQPTAKGREGPGLGWADGAPWGHPGPTLGWTYSIRAPPRSATPRPPQLHEEVGAG